MEICLGICAIIATSTLCIVLGIGAIALICCVVMDWALKDNIRRAWLFDEVGLLDEE